MIRISRGRTTDKPPAPEGDVDSKYTAPDEVDAAGMCTAPEGETDSKCTASDDIIDRNRTATDSGEADCL